MKRIMVTAVLASTAAGCGEQERSSTAATPTPTRSAAPTPSPTPSPKPELEQARSEEECAQLWNEDALDDRYQVTANEFVAELAPVRVDVAYQRGDCYVVAPIGGRRIAIFTAADGRRPFTVPTRRRLKAGERFRPNARADRTGRVTLDE